MNHHFFVARRCQNRPQIFFVCRMQSEDLQQSGIRGVAVAIGVAGFRSGVPADAYVHNPDELREGLGCGIPSADGHLDSLLDRAAFKRAATVARQGTHADGFAPPTLFLDVLSLCILNPFVRKKRTRENMLSSSSSSSIDRSIRFFRRVRYVKVESVIQISLKRTLHSDA